MRAVAFGLVMVVMALFGFLRAQETPPTFRPDVTIVVREHSMGADMVEVTMSRSDYPQDLLLKQMQDLGARLGSTPRGLTVGVAVIDKANPGLNFIKAKFAVDGLIDRGAGQLRVRPLLQALAGAPEPFTIGSILLLFDGERPGPRTVKSHRTAAVEAEGRVTADPPMIEYAIRLKNQNPETIDFPDLAPEPSAVKKPSEKSSGTPVLFWSAVAVAGLAAGALVYLALLRGGAGPKVRR